MEQRERSGQNPIVEGRPATKTLWAVVRTLTVVPSVTAATEEF